MRIIILVGISWLTLSPLVGIYPTDLLTELDKDTCKNMFAALLAMAKIVSIGEWWVYYDTLTK